VNSFCLVALLLQINSYRLIFQSQLFQRLTLSLWPIECAALINCVHNRLHKHKFYIVLTGCFKLPTGLLIDVGPTVVCLSSDSNSYMLNKYYTFSKMSSQVALGTGTLVWNWVGTRFQRYVKVRTLHCVSKKSPPLNSL